MAWKETARIFNTKAGRVLLVKDKDGNLIGYAKVSAVQDVIANKTKSTDISVAEDNNDPN